jgi:hypothetical protein
VYVGLWWHEPPISTEPSNDATVESEAVSKPKKKKDWVYQIEGEEIGPVSFKKICHLYKTGKIGADDLIAQEGMNWIEAGIFLESAVVESAASEDEWFIIGSDQNQGPYTFFHLQGLFENKEISESSLIGRRGSKGMPAVDLIPIVSDTFYGRLLAFLQEQSDAELRVVAGVFGVLCYSSLWLLLGVPLWAVIVFGFGGGWLGALLVEKVFQDSFADNPIPFASVLAVSLFLSAYQLPAGLAEDGLLNPSGPKYSAFKALVKSYKSTPRGNVTANQLYRQLDAVRQAQEKFIKIPFDPVANPREAKKIADLYMRELYGRYDGELHQDLYSDHLTPIIDAVKGDVEIPWYVRSSWGLGR